MGLLRNKASASDEAYEIALPTEAMRESSGSLDYWRDKILRSLLLIALVAGFLTIVPSVWLSIREQLYFLVVFDCAVYATVLYAYFSNRSSYLVKAVVICSVSYLLGLVLLLVVGTFGAGPAWLFAFPVFAGILLGNRAALIALSINTATLVVVGFGLHLGVIEGWSGDVENPTAKWTVISVNFLFLNLLATKSLTTVLQGLQSALRYENQMKKSVKRSQVQLAESNRALQIENDEKKIAVANLHKSESRYRRLFNEAPVMYVITESVNGVPLIKDVNQLFLSTLGYTRASVIDQPLVSFYSRESAEALAEGGYEQVLSDMFTPRERCLIASNGDRHDTMLHLVPELDDQNRIKGARAMFVDITERKRAEYQAKRLEDNLHRSQRTEALGTLAGGIAHDFNNILSGILGYAELCVLQTPETSPIYKKIEAIHDAGTRARQLVRQILTFSRHNQQDLVPLQVDPLIKEALMLLRASLPATIELQKSIQPNLPSVLADATQIHQILMNLCTNAWQAMENDGGLLSVSARQVVVSDGDAKLSDNLKPGKFVRISVGDTGCGIPNDILPHIFEPYYTTKTKTEGTGLGLAVVHGIVRSYDGAIRVASKPDRGTTFDIYLPVIEKVPQEEDCDMQVPVTADGDAHILVVDDEPMVLDIASTMLRDLGYKVTSIGSASEALERFSNHHDCYDLLLLDMTMPKMNGDQLAAEMRKVRPDVPVILFSGYSKRLLEGKADGLHIDAVLLKPFKQAELAQTVRRVIDERRSDRRCLADDPHRNHTQQSTANQLRS